MDEHGNAKPSSAPPFALGWWSWNLGSIRPGEGTYNFFSYEDLPPIPAPDPNLRFLPPDEQATESAPTPEWMLDEWRKLANLRQEAQDLGLAIPDSFLSFMSNSRYTGENELGPCCWFNLSNHLVRCPTFDDGYLIGFLRDQQDCIVWCLCLTADGQCCVLAINDDALMTLSEREYDVLLGNDGASDEYYQATDAGTHAKTEKRLSLSLNSIVMCSDSFESFIYRFWIESEIAAKINPLDDSLSATLSEAQKHYLEHYEQVDQY